MTSSGSQSGKWSWGRKSNFFEKLKGIIFVFLWLIFILLLFVKTRRSASWCWSTDWSGGRERPGISRMFGGPNVGADGIRVVFRSIVSRRDRSSTYFFFRIFSCWWQSGCGPKPDNLYVVCCCAFLMLSLICMCGCKSCMGILCHQYGWLQYGF